MKKRILSLLLTLVLCVSIISPVIASATDAIPYATKSAVGDSDAYFVYEDRDTYGLWYTGQYGTYEYRDNRTYGKEGVILFYHGQTDDGNALQAYGTTFDDNRDTFKSMSNKTPHYIEYPEWISGMELLAGSTSCWNNNQRPIEERVYDAINGFWDGVNRLTSPLYVDYSEPEFLERYDGMLKVGNVGWFMDRGTEVAHFNFNVTDNDWHRVTVKIGDCFDFTNYRAALVEIRDANGNVLASTEALDVKITPYLTFMVKGNFQIYASGIYGYNAGGIQGIFFDDVYENNEIGISNLTSTLVGARQVDLSWTNTSENSYTNIYRRESGEQQFEYIATVAPGINTYSDTSTGVARSYEYTAVSGMQREFSADRSWDYYGYLCTGYPGHEITPDIKEFNLIDNTLLTSISTAPYSLTQIEIEGTNIGCMLGGKVVMNLKIYKDIVYAADGSVASRAPFAGAEVSFELSGDSVFGYDNGVQYENMNTDLGKIITNENGEATLSFTPDYVGEYEVTATFAERADPLDPMKGYDSSTAVKPFTVAAPNVDKEAPYLFEISDAIKPGDAFNITGNFVMSGNVCEVAYAPATGEVKRTFSRGIEGLKYLKNSDIYIKDNMFNTGLTAVFPKDAAPGIYDIWVRNAYGWSKAITMNDARIQFINQEHTYEGLPIEIVGRNLLGSEFGIADNTKVKIVRIGDINGISDGILQEYILDINTGIKYTADECYTGEEVQISNPFRIEITVPAGCVPGKYEIYVCNSGGNGFKILENTQHLIVHEKKAQSWNETVFGPIAGNTHIGNDPLDLKLGYAQDFNYNNVVIVDSQYISADGDYTAWGGDEKLAAFNTYLQTQINNLANAGGGVLYFPEGYYFTSGVSMRSNVILLGASREDTTIYFKCVDDEETFTNFKTNDWNKAIFSGASNTNYGIARMTVTLHEDDMCIEKNPNRFIVTNGKNIFVSEVDAIFYRPQEYAADADLADSHRALLHFDRGAYNILIQKFNYDGNDAITASYADLTIYREISTIVGAHCNSMSYNVAFVENTYYQSSNESHGWAGRREAYCAYNYIKDIGRKNGLCEGKGEIFLFEIPESVNSRGKILEATERTFTVQKTNGSNINEATTFGSANNIAIYINAGKGAGQQRFINKTPIASKDGVNYGNTYELCAWEEDWDVIPDHTSTYTIVEPMFNNTFYCNFAEDCSKTLMLYMWAYDTVIYGNRLYRTEGIQVISNELETSRRANTFWRVENNILDGISDGTGFGGIEIANQSTANFGGLGIIGGVIRGNVVKNMRNYEGLNGVSEYSEYNAGINILTSANEASWYGAIRNIIVENNEISNCEYGVRIDAKVYGVLLKNNVFSEIGVNGLSIPADEVAPLGGRATEDVTIINAHEIYAINETTFMVDGTISATLSREYGLNEVLPKLEKSGYTFLGWAKTAAVSDSSDILTLSDGTVCTLYPIFGYSVTFMNNYSVNGVDKGVYKEEKGLAGSEFPRLPKLFRAGHTFDGWYLDKDCTEKFEGADTITENVTLYAKWISNNAPDDVPDDNTDNTNPTVGIVIGVSAFAVVAIGVVLTIIIIRKRRGC